jgi:hypothetical protein
VGEVSSVAAWTLRDHGLVVVLLTPAAAPLREARPQRWRRLALLEFDGNGQLLASWGG